MITKTKQSWAVGNLVRVGFLQLRVAAVRAEGVYELESLDGTRQYEFTPYYGLTRVR